jgi:hypothetical protein
MCHADLAGAPRGRKRKQAVDPNGRDQQCQGGEGARHAHLSGTRRGLRFRDVSSIQTFENET